MTDTLAYVREGAGFPIVFVHGFCETKAIWQDFKHHFTPNFDVIRVDLPGFGESPSLGNGTSIENMAILLANTLNELQVQRPLLVGHSLGGYVILALAEQTPDLFSGLCIFHSTAFADPQEKKENRNKTIDYVEKHGVDAFCNPFVPGLFFHKRRAELKGKIDYVLQIARQTTLESIVRTTKAMRDRKDRTHVLESLQTPIAFIAGKEDTAVPVGKILEQCAVPKHSQVLFLSETGHMGMYERESESAKFLIGFAESLK